jgi:hypothetical protein
VIHARLDARAPKVQTAQGESTLVSGSDGVAVIARLDPRTTVAIDEPAELTVEVERLHFFDPDTGLAIRE